MERLIEFLYPFDLAGGRETVPSVSSSRLPKLYEHLQLDVADGKVVVLARAPRVDNYYFDICGDTSEL